MTQRWKQRPPGSTWGDWGEDDELGRINLLTPEKVLEGVREVEAGISFCLSLPLDYPGGTALNQRRYPPVLAPTEDMQGVADTFYKDDSHHDRKFGMLIEFKNIRGNKTELFIPKEFFNTLNVIIA